MSQPVKILITVLVLIGILFLLAFFFNLNPFSDRNPCPDGQVDCRFYPNGQPSSSLEPGRVRQSFFPNPPSGFPAGLPIDPLPLQIVESYKETMVGDETEGELKHTQLTYIYISQKDPVEVISSFKNYLQARKYKVSSESTETSKPTYILSGSKNFNQSYELITVNIAVQNQFERLVTINLIISEKIPQN